MPPKDKKQKGPKELLAASQLAAFQAMYKAGCKRHAVAPNKALLEALEAKLLEFKPLDKVILQGPANTGDAVRALTDALAGYPSVRSLCCWGCALGDAGLAALADLLKASAAAGGPGGAARGWRGSALGHLEVVGDGGSVAPDRWPERYQEIVTATSALSGGLRGPGMALPSLLLGDAPVLTLDTLRLSAAPLPGPAAGGAPAGPFGNGAGAARFSEGGAAAGGGGRAAPAPVRPPGSATGRLAAAAAPGGGVHRGEIEAAEAEVLPLVALTPAAHITTLTHAAVRAGVDARAAAAAAAAAPRVSALAPPPPAPPPHIAQAGLHAALRPPPPLPSFNRLSSAGAAAGAPQPRTSSDGGLGGASHRPSAQTLPPHAEADEQQHEHERQGGSAGGAGGHHLSAIASGRLASSFGAGAGPGSAAAAAAAAAASAAAARRGWMAVGEEVRDPSLFAPPPPAWGLEALSRLSLALGAQGLALSVLVLDHNWLGDEGGATLASGLRRCAKLQQLSLAHCGLGGLGGAALATLLARDPNPLAAEVQPKLKHLNLAGNPLGGAGVAALAEGLSAAPGAGPSGGAPGGGSLKVLNLADVGLGPHHAGPLQALADALARNACVDQVDLSANHIGDEGALVLLPFLQEQKHLRKFRLTTRLSRAVAEQVSAAVRANLPAPKKKAKKAAKK